MRLANGVTLATHLHPDASPSEVRSYQRKRGQRQKGHRGGRPRSNPPGHKKRLRSALSLRQCRRLRDQHGYSLRKLADLFGVCAATIRQWLLHRC
jgi:hypothetical protein